MRTGLRLLQGRAGAGRWWNEEYRERFFRTGGIFAIEVAYNLGCSIHIVVAIYTYDHKQDQGSRFFVGSSLV
jgi:hypothetical protein